MKRVRMLDVGVGAQGYEIEWMVKEILPSLGVDDYEIHGFEACWQNYTEAEARLRFPKVHLYRVAISDHEGTCQLYHANCPDGHSIYKTKCNVVAGGADFETVSCTRLSHWLSWALPAFPGEGTINILRFNVEGAEWPLFVDLEQSGLLKHFDFVCGACGGDIRVVAEIADRYPEWVELLRRNGKLDSMFWFCWDTINDQLSKARMRERLQALGVGAP